MSRALLALLAIACAACGPPYAGTPTVLSQGTVFEYATGSLSYQPPTARDVAHATPAGEARGEACQYGIVLPISLVPGLQEVPPLGFVWGNGGYGEAVANAQVAAKGGRLFDVRADLHTNAILGVFVRRCLEVHAAVAR
jgi:hypothetical protein